ncbi:formyltransferase family protein [Chryseobacterium arthrosphaerae]|uniref:formyltransferase family protein n=1 Tax=Chryseobacterium arthrosphaerae TaxID=651561 RepID=UPI001BB04DC8|nr:formyltransferase family protein [Chryseobacterium arthrosphaerae]MDG4652696.1 formyltransferase family protein [Chryseobacterium arthrosphaerae]QUY54264.1 hypothetical protein I2F65_15385 [Chryseobacterium arthrosphaerae]
MKIALFAYNFEHKKTQDFIFYLLANNYKIDIILAADPVQLNIKPGVVKTKIKHSFLIHPRKIAENFGIKYEVVEHNSNKTAEILKENGIDLGIISGARILKSHIIESCHLGILNLHPAILPECRGLDSLLWSLEKDIDMGVTGHLIQKQVDSGKIICKERIQIQKDDTILDINERLYDKQLDVLIKSLETLEQKDDQDHEIIDLSYPNYGKMEAEEEIQAIAKLDQYILKRTS